MDLNYVIRFVGDMKAGVTFFRDTLGLSLRFESPGWSEFDTGATTLALHSATADSPAGTCQLGLRVADVYAFHREMSAKGYVFTSPPTPQHGMAIARFRDADGAEISVSGPA